MLYALDTAAAHKNFHDKLRHILLLQLENVFHETQNNFFYKYTVLCNIQQS